ncbi:hypothetical protein Godav_027547 [Gossypium davidsonii]|uniref:Uncharacterized protein n=2 Tax=Gossypium TaxID=3633 RepID=A0A7J8RWE3_GOSDV|nr:hypothetical protein [Gossypium davidsonii]MBA0653514.1 hypothetical protein [Gossypium klotzschianum]
MLVLRLIHQLLGRDWRVRLRHIFERPQQSC